MVLVEPLLPKEPPDFRSLIGEVHREVLLLAYQSPRLIDFVVARTGRPEHTVSTITDPSQLKTELKKVRKDGYAIDFEEQEEGVRCLAAPVFGPEARSSPP